MPFASFFVCQFAGHATGAYYSSLDDLASLDRELYRSLTQVKHYQGDVTQLELTFSLDEDRLGQLITHELVTGGRTEMVTNGNRILYIHLMAHYRLQHQFKDQTAAFIKGFRSIINLDWLSMFSPTEVRIIFRQCDF